jgi:hypothetical protein
MVLNDAVFGRGRLEGDQAERLAREAQALLGRRGD